jgi:hypothetical protein
LFLIKLFITAENVLHLLEEYLTEQKNSLQTEQTYSGLLAFGYWLLAIDKKVEYFIIFTLYLCAFVPLQLFIGHPCVLCASFVIFVPAPLCEAISGVKSSRFEALLR